MLQTSILVPLYIYPTFDEAGEPDSWAPLIHALTQYPQVHFIVVVNPNSGPGGCPVLPDEQYRRAVPLLRQFPNITLLGYISTEYGNRTTNLALADIDKYWQWHHASMAMDVQGANVMGMDGIFIDQVESGGKQLSYFQVLCKAIKARQWSTGKAGYVILNPGCPCHEAYYDCADMVVVAERDYKTFSEPPMNHWDFRHLRFASPEYGLKLMIPSPGNPANNPKLSVALYAFFVDKTQDPKLLELKKLVDDLVCKKRLGSIFLTDLELEKTDVYASWGSYWLEMVDFVAQASQVKDP